MHDASKCQALDPHWKQEHPKSTIYSMLVAQPGNHICMRQDENVHQHPRPDVKTSTCCHPSAENHQATSAMLACLAACSCSHRSCPSASCACVQWASHLGANECMCSRLEQPSMSMLACMPQDPM